MRRLLAACLSATLLVGPAGLGCQGSRSRVLGRDRDGGAAAVATAAATAGPIPTAEPPSASGPEALPVADCPIPSDSSDGVDRIVDRLLDQAAAAFDGNRLGEAWTCADRAADLEPESVEAHHLRAAALAALGHDDEAQVAYAMALALDPEDPETLRAAADFYVNVKNDKGRDALLVGLELARRGSARATARRRGNGQLRANLALLEAQALDDLGKSDEALARASEALRLAPTLIDAVHERGVASFNLGRYDEARVDFTRVLGDNPDDPYAHHFLGLTYELLGRPIDAQAHFKRATELDAADFPAPIIISPAEFRAEIDAVLASLPPERKAELAHVPIEVADLPAADDLDAVNPPFPPTILGLFRGLAKDAPPPAKGEDVPARSIVLYRLNLGRAVKTRAELDEQIRRTLLHEIGHLEGLDEDDLRRRDLD